MWGGKISSVLPGQTFPVSKHWRARDTTVSWRAWVHIHTCTHGQHKHNLYPSCWLTFSHSCSASHVDNCRHNSHMLTHGAAETRTSFHTLAHHLHPLFLFPPPHLALWQIIALSLALFLSFFLSFLPHPRTHSRSTHKHQQTHTHQLSSHSVLSTEERRGVAEEDGESIWSLNAGGEEGFRNSSPKC